MRLIEHIDQVLLLEGRLEPPPVLVDAVVEAVEGMAAANMKEQLDFLKHQQKGNEEAVKIVTRSIKRARKRATEENIKEWLLEMEEPDYGKYFSLDIVGTTGNEIHKKWEVSLWLYREDGKFGAELQSESDLESKDKYLSPYAEDVAEIAAKWVEGAAESAEWALDEAQYIMKKKRERLEEALKKLGKPGPDTYRTSIRIPKDFTRGWRQARMVGDDFYKALQKSGKSTLALRLVHTKDGAGATFLEGSKSEPPSVEFRMDLETMSAQRIKNLIEQFAEHEIMHWTQFVIPIALGVSGAFGLPFGTDPGEASGHVLKKKGFSSYVVEPEEFFPWLNDEIRKIKRRAASWDVEIDNDFVASFIDSSRFFKSLKKQDRSLWKKAVREFYRAAK